MNRGRGSAGIRHRGGAPHRDTIAVLARAIMSPVGGRWTGYKGELISVPASLTGISQALHTAFPDLRLSGLQLVDTGFGSIVVGTSDGVIIRVGRTAAAARGHAVELLALPVLAPMLPIAVPVPVHYCPPGPQVPFGAIGYQRLAGRQCQPGTATETTGRQLGSFLAALHQIDAHAPGLAALPGPEDVWQQWLALRKSAEPVVRRLMTTRENQRLDRWWDRLLADPRMRHYQPAVRHGDLWYGNLLIREHGAISGVLDWEMAAIADPAQDLALARYVGARFTGTVVEAYRSSGGPFDRQTQYRADRHWELRELTGIPLARAVNDEAEISECISNLRAGPIFG
jgi:aminoglycoside 2''-phosphotransferase